MNSRYTRQETFKGIGKEGQKRLREKHALILGVGALGSANAEMLVRAGVGTVTIIDRDIVEWSNLHRQQLYTETHAENQTPKAIAAKERLQNLNRETVIKSYVIDAKADNLEKLVKEADVIIDGSDNFDIRFIINDLSLKYRIPWIFGAFAGSFGMSHTFIPGQTPCLQCLLPALPTDGMSCETAGIIAPAVQVTASYQTAEAMKILTENTSDLRQTLLLFDVWKAQHQSIGMKGVKKASCSSCGDHPSYPYLQAEGNTKLEVLCGRDTVQIRPPNITSYNFSTLARELEQHGDVHHNQYILTCVLPECRMNVFHDGRVLIHGVNEVERAKLLYQRFFEHTGS
ncbi:ThiF family adenylyltransferase [Alteribacillus iranensis]|uniref:Adenylyltransferase and sulfurtransferase n=1 Tax=Alteribacillus iranensis TaxID=930128 RepID=A0A1I2B155_9BACI|nr:ThiF family adenylyltransferase [Alteribacillus iranensis]SFE49737.1 adenylyltransferase and sulfurtransferase [Alteribacillus iranensis]